MPKDFPYKKIFNAELLRLFESGMLDSLRQQTFDNLLECNTIYEDVAPLGPGSTIKKQYE